MHVTQTQHNWSAIRKAQVIGAVAGPVLTAATFVISMNRTADDGMAWWLLGLNLLLCAPALLVLRLFGIAPVFGPQTGSAWTPFVFFTLFTNMILFSLAGTAVAWLWERHRASKAKPGP